MNRISWVRLIDFPPELNFSNEDVTWWFDNFHQIATACQLCHWYLSVDKYWRGLAMLIFWCIVKHFTPYQHVLAAIWRLICRGTKPGLKRGRSSTMLKNKGLASAWAMAKRRPKEYRRKVNAATLCSGVCHHTWPDLNPTARDAKNAWNYKKRRGVICSFKVFPGEVTRQSAGHFVPRKFGGVQFRQIFWTLLSDMVIGFTNLLSSLSYPPPTRQMFGWLKM